MQITVVIDDDLLREARKVSAARSEREMLETALRVWLSDRKQRLRQAKQLVRQYVKPQGSIVDELIQKRRQAALDE